MNYDIVIATRNRSNLLRKTIPTILAQERKPNKLIIVDASDDHERTCQTVLDTIDKFPIKLEILQSEANLPLQRNIGLNKVESPIVMFPDDDVFWLPGAAEAVMRIYERDTAGVVGAVAVVYVPDPPDGTDYVSESGYKMRYSHRIRQKFNAIYSWLSLRVFPDPLWIHGFAQLTTLSELTPKWLSAENAVIGINGGFSYRVECFSDRGYDADLGAYVGYAKCEDTEACFHVMHNYILVGARNAKLFHHKHPSNRAEGFKLGFISQLNRTYVVCKHSPKGSKARAAIKRFSIFMLLQYISEIHTKFGRDRVRGTLSAMRAQKELLSVSPNCLRKCYLRICEKIIGQHPHR